MKTKTKHTLGKCRVRESAQVYVDGRHVADCNAKDQREVATLHIKLEDEANAERIAHCWNCHDDLLDALKELLAANDEFHQQFPDTEEKSKASVEAIALNVTRQLVAECKARAIITALERTTK